MSVKNIPILLYFSANRRLSTENGKGHEPKIDNIFFPQGDALTNAFYRERNYFNDFLNWFREEENIENEQIRRQKNFDLKNPKLETVRRAMLLFFNKIGTDAFTDLRVERTQNDDSTFKKDKNPSLVISKNGEDLRLEQLSDGEKMTLLIVCDIARRLSIASPGLDDPLKGEGIVLIDEIELHLHPKWQREVIPALMGTFPNIQLIVTTHSPQVLSRVDDDDIFLLDDGEVFRLGSNPKGRDSNAILEEIMGVGRYPDDVQRLVDKLFPLIQQKRYDEASKIRQQIVEKSSPENPVLRQADAMMQRIQLVSQ